MEKSEINISFIAIMGEQYEPIAMRCFGVANEQDMQFSAYAAMDIVQEKLLLLQDGSGDAISDPFLGFICPSLVGEDFYKIYAYAAATGFKILAIIKYKDIPHQSIREVKIH
ncbi:Longin-like domain superfamily [Babesia duncani]|uniref:Longin-like domain superfamily n=1 Tax=Babesia duncani TaxID=323732 RepID=A0AAD9PNP6_9APIC|nr:Longin-like domain superfamily [Babesia duncani]